MACDVMREAGRRGFLGWGARGRGPRPSCAWDWARKHAIATYLLCQVPHAHAQAGHARWRSFCAIGRVYACADAGRFIWPSNSYPRFCSCGVFERIRAAGAGLRANCVSTLGGQGGVEGPRPNAANWVRQGCPKRRLRLGHMGCAVLAQK